MIQKTGALATTLQRLRDVARMSQKELADSTAQLGEHAAVSVGTIRAIESRTTIPKPTTIRKLADGLARDAFTGDVVGERAATIYRELMEAAGYIRVSAPAEVATGRPEEPSDAELNARLAQYASDPDTYIALMQGLRDFSRLSREAKLAIIETVENAGQRRQG